MPYLILVWVHVLAAIAWIGGMLFVGVILVPLVRDMPPRDRARLLHIVGVRFSLVGWACIGILLITGPWLLLVRGRLGLLGDPAALAGSAAGHVLLVKLGAVLAMVGLSVAHDFFLGPRLVAALGRAGNPDPAAAPQVAALRRRTALLARLNAGLGLSVVALGVMLGRM